LGEAAAVASSIAARRGAVLCLANACLHGSIPSFSDLQIRMLSEFVAAGREAVVSAPQALQPASSMLSDPDPQSSSAALLLAYNLSRDGALVIARSGCRDRV
jgi:hypothetical protein